MKIEEALENLKMYLSIYYPNITIDDLVITDSKGYFRMKKKCGGKGVCNNMIHSCLFNEGGIQHTIYFTDDTKDCKTGRFLSPYRTWNCIKEARVMES